MIDPVAFRKALPEFSETERYSSSTIEFWIAAAYQDLNAERLGAELDRAAIFYVAHEVALGHQAAQAASFGGTPGIAKGVMTQKHVDKVSAGYDATVGMEDKGAGYYNRTLYGQRLWRMLIRYCLGPVYRAPANARARFIL